MWTFEWQNVAALALICWAIVQLARAAVRVLAKKESMSACGGCRSCASNSTSAPPPNFVRIESLRRVN